MGLSVKVTPTEKVLMDQIYFFNFNMSLKQCGGKGEDEGVMGDDLFIIILQIPRDTLQTLVFSDTDQNLLEQWFKHWESQTLIRSCLNSGLNIGTLIRNGSNTGNL